MTMTAKSINVITLSLPFVLVWVAVAFAPKSSELFRNNHLQQNPQDSLFQRRMQESDRRDEYNRRNYSWPLDADNFVPNTPGWKTLMERRMQQVQCIEDLGHRYNGWLSVMTSAQTVPNFTEHGFALTRAPPMLLEELQQSLRDGLLQNEQSSMMETEDGNEIIVAAIEDENDSTTKTTELLPPLWIPQEDLNAKVLEELHPIHTDFVNGIDLIGAKAYGLRVYRNQSMLLMHSDKPDTHIVGSILHIDHSEDSKDWPIVVEDFKGNTHEIVMEAGDMLLYESAKVYHGRPRAFDGSWYCSIFSHYYPADWDVENEHWESHYAVPPCWFDSAADYADDDVVPKLEVVGTGIREPNNKDGWEALETSLKWKGPVPSGGIYDLPTGRSKGGLLKELLKVPS